MIRRHAVFKLLFVFSPIAVASLVVCMKTMGPRYWWFGMLLAQAIYLYISETVFKGQNAFLRLGKERIVLNLRAAGLNTFPKMLGYQWRFVLIACLVGFTFVATIQTDLQRGLESIIHLIKPEQLWARIEYPAWVEATPVEKKLESNPVELQADTASFLDLHIKNLKSSTWSVTLTPIATQAEANPGLPLSISLGYPSTIRWGQSISTLYEMLGIEKSKKYSLQIVAQSQSGEKLEALVKIAPLTFPVVMLAPAPDAMSANPNDLIFSVSAQSRVPLTTIDLEARTKSGYRFSKTAAEFSGSDELLLKSTKATLSTLGIPFSEHDVLYVKAVARTIVDGLHGESKEIAIPVQSRDETRRELAKQLEETLKLFENEKSGFSSTKDQIGQNLADAQSLASSLGRQSFANKKVDEARMLANRMQKMNDAAANASKQRIRSVIESLKRSQAMQETASLFARMQSLRNNIQRSSAAEIQGLATEARKLSSNANDMKKKLDVLSKESSFDLSNEEKLAVQKLLNSDSTGQKLSETAQRLQTREREFALQKTTEAIAEAQKKLGGVAQILMGARQRAIKMARQQLTDADEKFQNARTQQLEKANQDLRTAEHSLKKVPKLSKELTDATSDAQQASSQAIEAANKSDSPKFMESLNSAQDAIVRALEALQDEDQQERDQQSEMDSMEHRSAQDLITAQGILDAGWRKLILEEISRLRAKGESPDSSVLKFLESRLR